MNLKLIFSGYELEDRLRIIEGGISTHQRKVRSSLDIGLPFYKTAEETLGIREGETTNDGKFSLEGVECISACTEAPCMQTITATRTKSPNPNLMTLSSRSETENGPIFQSMGH